MAADADKGVSKAVEDNIIPLIYILQALSPQVTRGTPEYIEGAVAGDIWLRGTKTIIKGDVGMVVQPCHFSKCVIEWQQNRGGFVARHAQDPAGAVMVDDPRDETGKRKIKRTSKDKGANDLVDSREHVVILRDYDGIQRAQPYVIPMSGSQHTASRQWMMLMNSKAIPGSSDTPPAFACLYRMKTAPRTNGTHNWFGWDIIDASDDGSTKWVETAEDYAAGRKIFQDFNSGALRADMATDLQDMDGGAGSGEMSDGNGEV